MVFATFMSMVSLFVTVFTILRVATPYGVTIHHRVAILRCRDLSWGSRDFDGPTRQCWCPNVQGDPRWIILKLFSPIFKPATCFKWRKQIKENNPMSAKEFHNSFRANFMEGRGINVPLAVPVCWRSFLLVFVGLRKLYEEIEFYSVDCGFPYPD